tara:strand:+ start:504 stop:848 length:345 start_codon:yes stop_codon:yes gene_type:complete
VSIATSESWADRQTGEKKERTEWHKVVMFDRHAELAKESLYKGSKVYIEGSIRTIKWVHQDTARENFSTQVVAKKIQMLGSDNSSLETYHPKANIDFPKRNFSAIEDSDHDIRF